MIERIGITGSHGHVGERLYRRLKNKGINVERLDRSGELSTELSTIFDLAAYGNRPDQTNPNEIYNFNIDRVRRMFETSNQQVIVFTSSSSVLLPIQTEYSESKTEMERMVKSWVSMTGDPFIVARPSTITGIGEPSIRLIPKLIHSAFTGEEMPFVGEPYHDFIDVDDFIDGIVFLSKYASKYAGQVFNVSFGLSLPNEFIKDSVAKIIGKDPNIKRVENMRKYDTPNWRVPNDKLLALGWSPTKTVIDSIKEMVEEYEINHGL